MLNKSRRTLLKGLASASTLSLVSLPSLALAQSNGRNSNVDEVSATGDIHLLPTQNANTKTLSLFNHSDTNVTIGGIDQINLGDESNFLAIKLNTDGPSSKTLAPGESREFLVASNNDIALIRQFSANTQAMPVTVFDTKAA